VTIDSGYLNHPCEDALERFLMDRCFDNELAYVEMHILCCESCVTRLEELALEMAVIRLCLHGMSLSQLAKRARSSLLTLV
jgi:hypothetical protein